MRIAIITDAWHPQVNGVVKTLSYTIQILQQKGHEVQILSPAQFKTFACPTYPEIRIALALRSRVAGLLDKFRPEAVHITTEGALGLAGRSWCLRKGYSFTTSYHTRFPEYLRLRVPIPLALTYRYLRWFHRPACGTMVSTPSLREELRVRGFKNLLPWSRGVDTELFRPHPEACLPHPHPIYLYLGRVAVEKNIEAFLGLKLAGTKYVIGDGPALALLRERYPDVRFTGYKQGLALVQHLAAADVMVFPSLTDTFGLVLLEAMACGVPVAAYPVPGPKDLIINGKNGFIDEDLNAAVQQALHVPRESCRTFAERYSWQACTEQFFSNLQFSPEVPLRPAANTCR
jgi:glycosyltransferase involved in cell wall biosynthesis